MFINITTEGFVNDGYLDKELKYARQVLNGEIDDPTLLAWLYTQDTETEIWSNEKSWQKSNPSLGVIKKIDYLRDQIRKAQVDKGERVFVLTKDFNLHLSQAEAWMTPEEIQNDAVFNIEDFRGCIGLAGIDLSEVVDLTCAKVLLMKPGDPKKYILTKYFIPESKIEQGAIEDKKNYLDWAAKGFIDVSPGNEIDYSRVTAWIVSLYKQYGIRCYKVVMDKWGANYLSRELDEVGYDTEKINFEKYNISSPMKAAEADFKSKFIIYNQNPVDVWCYTNTGIKVDSLGLIMPVKVQQNMRIDGTAALLLCYYGYQKYRTEYVEIIKR
jgi:phage terminase large subunit-like protein